MDPPERVAEFEAFLARGDCGYYGYLGDRVVHRSWLVRGPGIMRLWRRFGEWAVREGEAYIHYCETAPEARGHAIYPAALSRIANDTAAQGTRRLFIATEAENPASQRGIERAGFVECARVTVHVRFGVGSQKVIETRST